MSDTTLDLTYLASVVTRCAGVPTSASALADDPDFNDLGVDSLGLLGIVTELENHLQVTLPEGAENAERPSQLIDIVINRSVRRS
jgi:minimal PKS acyl carrier protein